MPFKKSWPEGFYDTLSKEVSTFATKKKQVEIGNKVADPEAIYASSLFDKDGNVRLDKSKSDLKHLLGVTINGRSFGTPTHIVIDVSAFLWTLKWPIKGKFSQVLHEIKRLLRDMLKLSDVHWIQDRYRDFSPKSACRISRTTDVAGTTNLGWICPSLIRTVFSNASPTKSR